MPIFAARSLQDISIRNEEEICCRPVDSRMIFNSIVGFASTGSVTNKERCTDIDMLWVEVIVLEQLLPHPHPGFAKPVLTGSCIGSDRDIELCKNDGQLVFEILEALSVSPYSFRIVLETNE